MCSISIREKEQLFLPDSKGATIHARLAPKEEEYIVVKNFPNSFYQTSLWEILKKLEVGELVVCGMMTHMCVDTTVRAAKDYGVSVTLLHDGCATKSLLFQEKEVPAD